MILKPGEARVIRLLVCSQVLAEAEGALRRKAPDALRLLALLLALLLDRSQAEVVSSPAAEAVWSSQALTGHPGDAQVLAAAWEAGADYFVTLDREHFLDNPGLRGAVPFPISTPGDFLAWYRGQLA